jgi:hypothetical protein
VARQKGRKVPRSLGKFGEVWGSLGKFGEVWGTPNFSGPNLAFDTRIYHSYFAITRYSSGLKRVKFYTYESLIC